MRSIRIPHNSAQKGFALVRIYGGGGISLPLTCPAGCRSGKEPSTGFELSADSHFSNEPKQIQTSLNLL
jgi:hypothetical protein